MLATSAGIGLFLAFTGLLATQGLGLSVYSGTTVVTIGTFRRQCQLVVYDSKILASSEERLQLCTDSI